jgi:hypothetical protein
LPETFARGGDLAAIYAATDGFPFRAQAYWRLASHPANAANPVALASCELVVATQTDLLDSRPDISVTSGLPMRNAFHLVNPAEGEFRELDPARSHRFTPTEGAGCWLYRFASIPFSYAEMVFPLDFASTSLEFRLADNQRVATPVHRLFAHRLEKGVVLRSRVLGLWMDSTDDLKTTAAHYTLFAKSDPPLTA